MKTGELSQARPGIPQTHLPAIFSVERPRG